MQGNRTSAAAAGTPAGARAVAVLFATTLALTAAAHASLPAGGGFDPADAGAVPRRAHPSLAPLATIQLLFPSRADTFPITSAGGEIGARIQVRWSSSADVDRVGIDHSRTGPNGPWERIDLDPFNAGSATVLLREPPSSDSHIRVVGYTALGDSVEDRSDAPLVTVYPADPVMDFYVAQVVDAGVLLRWRFPSRATLLAEWVERARLPGTGWEAVHPVWSMEADTTVAIDTLAIAGASYLYRVATYHNDASIHGFTPYLVTIPAPRRAAFAATSFDAAVEVRWRFDTPPAILRTVLERGEAPYQAWQPAQGTLRTEGPDTVLLDETTVAGATYAYRLTVRVPGGQHTDSILVTVAPPASRVTLSAARPNPASGAVRFEVELPADADVRLRVLDIQGRQVARVHDGPLPRGRHTLAWAGAGDPDILPGVYLAELRTPQGTRYRRVVVTPLR